MQEIIDKYNSWSSSADAYYEDLVQYVGNIREESERHIREGLSENELEIYDLLKKDKLTKAEEQRVKLAAKDLIIRLLEGHPKVLVKMANRNRVAAPVAATSTRVSL